MTRVQSLEACVEVEVDVHPSAAFLLHIDAGETTGPDGQKFELSNDTGGQPIVRVPDGRWVVFSWRHLLAAAVRATTDSAASE